MKPHHATAIVFVGAALCGAAEFGFEAAAESLSNRFTVPSPEAEAVYRFHFLKNITLSTLSHAPLLLFLVALRRRMSGGAT